VPGRASLRLRIARKYLEQNYFQFAIIGAWKIRGNCANE
jgi:hypothetical protein